jgi:hypothetical protein
MRKAVVVSVSSLYLVVFPAIGTAQTDIEADPAHHKLEFENNCVRVVRATFGPHEKSAGFFDAKDVVIVSLTGSPGFKLTFPDGNSINTPPNTPGQVFMARAGRILPENISDSGVQFLVIEPKGSNCQ